MTPAHAVPQASGAAVRPPASPPVDGRANGDSGRIVTKIGGGSGRKEAPRDTRVGAHRWLGRCRTPGGDGEGDDRHSELHRLGGVDGPAHAGDVRGHWSSRAVAAGRGGARERARDLGGRRRRPESHVQRAHGHVVLRPRAVASPRARVPAGALRRGRAALRARRLEHEGRSRQLRRGFAGAHGCGSAAPRRCPCRSRVRGDRKGTAG